MANPRMTAEIGRVLGGRYRLVAPIGMGASAQVYLADDVRLRRRVALKMLHDALAGDAEFLRRFRAEARAAAALSHPNVMAVYDWGDDDIAFIVTEYLGGGSLRDLLDQGGLLSPSQALTVGLEATRALDYAHRRGFVHRDIKPANLLFGEEQRLRIADFGLARALAEAAWTEPQGALLGTARYASPEQAKGEKLDGKADVYALALVLVEAVTGKVPFAADTTLGTLMARVDRQLEVPDALGPLQNVLRRAGHPDPEQRIDARGLAAGLLRAAKELPKPAPLPLAGALPRSGELTADPDPTVHGPVGPAVTVPTAQPDLTADDLDLAPPAWVNQSDVTDADAEALLPVDDVAPALDDEAEREADQADEGVPIGLVVDLTAASDQAPDQEPEEQSAVVAGPAWSDDPAAEPEPVDRIVDRDATVAMPMPMPMPKPVPMPGPLGRAEHGSVATAVAPPLALDPEGPFDPDDPDDGNGRRRRRRWPWVVLVFLLLAGGGGTAAAMVLLDGDGPTPPARVVVLPVPALEGRSQDVAESVIEAGGWKATVVTERRDGTVKGTVVGTTPSAGTRLEQGGSIELTVSAGQTEVPVPTDLAGTPLDEATLRLATLGLKVVTEETLYSEEVAEGSVIGVAGETPPLLEKGLAVPLVVSRGPEPRIVPGGLVGGTEEAATAAIEALQLEVAVNRRFSDTVAEGTVMSQLPKPGARLGRGGTVTIEVSRGPELVAVPDVSAAKSPAEAAAILRQAGLVPGSVSGTSEGSPSTSPAAGTMVKKGSTVNIVLG